MKSEETIIAKIVLYKNYEKSCKGEGDYETAAMWSRQVSLLEWVLRPDNPYRAVLD